MYYYSSKFCVLCFTSGLGRVYIHIYYKKKHSVFYKLQRNKKIWTNTHEKSCTNSIMHSQNFHTHEFSPIEAMIIAPRSRRMDP